MTIVITMAKLILAMALGFYLGKKEVLNAETVKKVSSIIVTFTGPAMVLGSVADMGGQSIRSVLVLLIYGTICYGCLPFVGYLMGRLLKVDRDLAGTYMLTILLCNNTFMGFPVVQSLFGNDAIFLTAVLHFAFNIMFYTLGLSVIRKDGKRTELEKQFEKDGPTATFVKSTFRWKNIINPGTIAAIAAMIIFFGGLEVPAIIVEPVTFVGALTMPLSMILIGANMSRYKMKEVLGDWRIYVVACARLMLVPIVIFFTSRLVFSDMRLVQIATITFGMPVAALVAMGPAEYEKQGKVGAIAVAFTTICSMLTIPIWALILGVTL